MQFDFHNKIIDLAGRYAFGVCIAHFDLVGFFPCCRVNTISKGRKEPCLTNIYGDVLLPPVASRQPRWGVPMSLCNIGHLRPPFPMETPSYIHEDCSFQVPLSRSVNQPCQIIIHQTCISFCISGCFIKIFKVVF